MTLPLDLCTLKRRTQPTIAMDEGRDFVKDEKHIINSIIYSRFNTTSNNVLKKKYSYVLTFFISRWIIRILIFTSWSFRWWLWRQMCMILKCAIFCFFIEWILIGTWNYWVQLLQVSEVQWFHAAVYPSVANSDRAGLPGPVALGDVTIPPTRNEILSDDNQCTSKQGIATTVVQPSRWVWADMFDMHFCSEPRV